MVRQGEPPNDIRGGMKWLWDDDNSEIIDRFVFAAKEGALTATLVDRPQESQRVGLFAAAGQGDYITGSRDRDFIFGGDGNDTLRGALGEDLLAGGKGDDRLSGGAGRNYFAGGEGKDTVFYEEQGNPPLDLTLTTYKENTEAGEVALQLDLSIWRVDRAMGIEKVELSNKGDTVTVPERPQKLATNVVVDGRDAPQGSDADATLADTLDFSNSAVSLYIDYARTNIVTDALGLTGAPYAVEIYSKYSPIVQWGQWIWNLFVPTGEPSGQGMYDGTGLRFTNFEHVIGSDHNDRMSLWRLSPGGELDAQQEIALDAARSIVVSFASGDPATIAAAYNARTQQAGLILQNQQDVLIEGGDGNDAIVGTRTGADRIYGGDGVDKLYAGGFTSEIYGGAGSDYVVGGGFRSRLYGGDGSIDANGNPLPNSESDIFGLAGNSYVMDAGTNDFATWGAFRLTGGVQQWWMEGALGLHGAVLQPDQRRAARFLNVFGALPSSSMPGPGDAARYGMTESNQLVVQFARGRGGQAIVENYGLDLETGEGDGQHRRLPADLPREASLADFTPMSSWP